jgi:orotate phosphoribosyltransferase
LNSYESNKQDIAKVFLQTKAVQINSENLFTFASGIKSPIYCDNRLIVGFVKEREIIIKAFIEKIVTLPNMDVIMGVATAGIPWASFLAHELKKPMGYVRGQKKDHGTARLIEGYQNVEGKNVLLIEDLITMGNSVMSCVKVLLEQKVKSVSVLCIFKYGFKQAQNLFQSEGISFDSLLSLEDLLETGHKENLLTEKDILTVKEWKKSRES